MSKYIKSSLLTLFLKCTFAFANNMDSGHSNHNNMGDNMTDDGHNHGRSLSNMDDMKENKFCTGNGMSMNMEGYSLSFGNTRPCLNLWFSNWTLDTEWKFTLAILGVICLGICVEGSSVVRRKVHASLRPGSSRKWVMAGFYGLQATIGYALMMVAMTFSLELLLSAICGLVLGYGFFTNDESSCIKNFDQLHIHANDACDGGCGCTPKQTPQNDKSFNVAIPVSKELSISDNNCDLESGKCCQQPQAPVKNSCDC
jgi:hypothetical protein